MNSLDFIRKAPAEKRYKNFLTTVADREEVWLLDNSEGYATYNQGTVIHLLVWPTEKFAASCIANENEVPVSVNLDEFMERCKHYFGNPEFRFMVSPTNDAIIVDAETLYDDLTEALAEIDG